MGRRGKQPAECPGEIPPSNPEKPLPKSEDPHASSGSPWSKLPAVIDRSLRTKNTGRMSEIAIPSQSRQWEPLEQKGRRCEQLAACPGVLPHLIQRSPWPDLQIHMQW